jgi:uncharacterized protein
MRLGILSDSHGRHDTTRAAVKLLMREHADLLIHLGDIGSDRVLEELAGHATTPVRIVFGNCDWDEGSLAEYARHLGVVVDHPMGRLEATGKSLAFTHGHFPDLMRQALTDGVDYLLHGHTHELRDERVGRTRIINPGALFRAARYTAALLDPEADTLQILEVPRAA